MQKSTPTVFFTSDTHFSDARIRRIERRPSSSLLEHDMTLMTLWQITVEGRMGPPCWPPESAATRSAPPTHGIVPARALFDDRRRQSTAIPRLATIAHVQVERPAGV